MDRSLTMFLDDGDGVGTRWDAIAAATDSFLNAPDSAGLGAGLAFFPLPAAMDDTPLVGNASCSAADYVLPTVPIGVLPGTARAITSAIAAEKRMFGTPTAAALGGAYRYVRTRQLEEPNRDVAVLLVTDGLPYGCDDLPLQAACVAAGAGAGSTPPIRTYVLGVGPNLDNLNALAQAGGTASAYLVESGGASALTDALNAIRANTISCEYLIPSSDAGVLDPDSAKVQVRVGMGGLVEEVPRVANAAACDSGGWFYDDHDGPTRLQLCRKTCGPLLEAAGSTLDILIGCR